MHQEGLLPVVSSYKGTQWFSPPNSNSMPLVRNKVASPFLPFLGHPFLYFILLAWSPDSKICDTFNFSMKLLVSLIKTFAHINKEKKKNIVLWLFIVFVFCFASTMKLKKYAPLKIVQEIIQIEDSQKYRQIIFVTRKKKKEDIDQSNSCIL